MFAAPIEGTLKDFMEFGDAGCADHEQAPPPADSLRRALREVDRSQGTIRKVQTCGQFTQDTPTASNMTPQNLPLSHSWGCSNKGTLNATRFATNPHIHNDTWLFAAPKITRLLSKKKSTYSRGEVLLVKGLGRDLRLPVLPVCFRHGRSGHRIACCLPNALLPIPESLFHIRRNILHEGIRLF